MKALLVVCDGLADRPMRELGDLTPLEAARKPIMDEIAKRGICGLMDPIAPGIAPGSDTAHLSLLGYDPFEVYSGRGPFEAAGAGIDLKPRDIAFRVNFSTVDEKLILKDRRAGRIQNVDELEQLVQRVKIPNVKTIFKGTSSHRAVLVLRGKGLSHEVSDNDPHVTGVRVPEVKPLNRRAVKTAKLLNSFLNKSHQLLKSAPLNLKRIEKGFLPANYLLLRGGGIARKLEPLEKRFFLRGACIAATALVRGVCKLAGMDVIRVPSSTTGVDTDLDAEVNAVLESLEEHDFVLYSIKGFDEASHDGDAEKKIAFIEQVDEKLSKLMDEVDFLILTADHTTATSTKKHVADPVPVVIMGPGVRTDDVTKFDERSCAKGGLCRIRGMELLPILVNFMGKVRKFGA